MLQNNIKQLRTQLSITQRELAFMVGTSQQQIQRIESGKVAARLGLAQAICSALDKPLNAVFPGGENTLKKVRSQYSCSDEELENIATSGIEMDCNLWTVKLWLQGQQDYLLLPISSADKRRFYYYFQEQTAPNIERFFVFNSEQHRYALNIREVVFHQFLADGLPTIVDEEDDYEDDYFNVHITLVNGGPVIPLSVESDAPQNEEAGDIGQLNAFFEMLDCEPETTDRYMITDEDGEDAFIRIGSIAMVRVALDVLDPVEDDDE
ncbi:helix-turn-helix transcriptional regulator [Salmonella enterica subsp. enterica]|uniref:helix-turn-helix transcriptional regulator n=1 Tax=Salmonella enterica TaxID=28901 RepID=UPI00107D88A9|nr:helix-turn-helix transcriptional regulator [Salmonella enterica]EAO1509213.1 XRE family transcriptional regulator [Salmonella enterica subsp. enterica serovar Bere]ECF6837856.1 XRE family transcriptional regulator [Salmonella enterica subsp. enterica]EEJ2509496.1 helix-turn-helix transcriptional regulator [Salmonella enterica subsp. arizonae serovar 47:z4,z23:-]EHG3456744.1 helix-turn-helix transcriptional regulator [Salmonella enterica subsp. enterica serovar Moero]EHJ5081841.1 helix-turn-